ncbi:MAG: hypothetical protein WCI95_09550 [bacterium]
MKRNNHSLTALWSAAILAAIVGVVFSFQSLRDLGRTTEIWHKRTNDLQAMMTMRTTAATHRNLLELYAQYPAAPAPPGELARLAVPGLILTTRSTETHPSAPGWTARKVNLGLTDISGNDLGRFLEAVSTASPPWAILDCTVSASPTPGHLAKVELVLETVERSIQ